MYPSGQPGPGYPQPGYPPHGGADSYPNPNMNAGAPGAAGPSAPPPNMFDAVSGYENTSFGQGYLPPPPTAPAMPEPSKPDEEFTSAANITSEEAQDAMLEFVAQNCCYGSSPAKEMIISDIQPTSAYHYKLSTFTESRSTAWQVEPFTGQIIDGPHNGPAPGPWQVDVKPARMFSPSTTHVEVPHTASVKQCHTCYGGGYKQCQKCLGRGWGKCTPCNGSGRVTNEFHEQTECTHCQGKGEGRCTTCKGDGRVKCDTCQGHARLKTFIQLTVKWTNHEKDHVIERSHGGPKEKITGARGIEIFHQEYPRVWPITSFFEREINVASQRIVSEHANAWPKEMILMQRQSLRAVPVAEVSYAWQEKQSRFWVYGSGPRQVYAPDYPQQCCCGCVIL